jgi:hypothetical protein
MEQQFDLETSIKSYKNFHIIKVDYIPVLKF